MRPAIAPSPATSGASSLPSNSHCMPTQIPNSGSPDAAAPADRVAPRGIEPGGRAEVADARHDEAARAPALLGCRRDDEVGAECGERLADRRQIAGAVVDERNHNSPFVLGSILARRASLAHATRRARANALKTASM